MFCLTAWRRIADIGGAAPFVLVLPEEQREDTDAFIKTHLNDSNFQGEMLQRLEGFVKTVSAL